MLVEQLTELFLGIGISCLLQVCHLARDSNKLHVQ